MSIFSTKSVDLEGSCDHTAILEKCIPPQGELADCAEDAQDLGDHRGTAGGIILQQPAAPWNSLCGCDKRRMTDR
jgi:hypothetical protein